MVRFVACSTLLFPTASTLALEATSILFNTQCEFFLPDVKRSEREANHVSPSTAEVNNAWNYNSQFRIYLHGRRRIPLSVCFRLALLSQRIHTELKTAVFLQKIVIDKLTASYTNLKILCRSCKSGNPDGDFRAVPQFFQAHSLTVP